MSAPGSILTEALARCRGPFVAIAAFSAGVNILMLTAPIYMMQVYDRVLASRSFDTLMFLTIIAVGAMAVLALLEAVRSRILTRANTFLEEALAPGIFERVIGATLQGHTYRADALRDLASVRGFLGGAGVTALFDVPWIPIYVFVIFMIHPVIGWITVAGAVLLFLLALANELSTRRRLAAASVAAMRAMRQVDTAVRNAEVIESMGLFSGFCARWFKDVRLVLTDQERASDRAATILSATKFVRLVLQIVVLAVGAWLVVLQEMTAGAMIAGSIVMGRALAPVEQAIGTWKGLVTAHASYQRLVKFLAGSSHGSEGMSLPAPTGRLSVEAASYGAPNADRLILRGVSFALNPGESVAIIGPSGAGKSTLARMAVGVLRPTAGHVRLDGANVSAWVRAEFGQYVGYLPQDVELFDGSVRDNIGRMTDAPASMLVEAAQLAGVHDLVLGLQNGYDTQIGEGGARLSAGQRQRIALARALFGRPRLLVLDEPNSNLDAEGEEALANALRALKRDGSTVAIVTHRPNLLTLVDSILILRDGAVEAFGPRQEVLDVLTRRRAQAQTTKAAYEPKSVTARDTTTQPPAAA